MALWCRGILALAAMGLGACDGSEPAGPPVPKTVEIRTALDTLPFIGATAQLVAVARDAHGDAIPDAVIEWSSLDPEVVNVDDSGRVTALSAGAGRVAARAGSAQGMTTLHVVQVPFKLEVSPTFDTLTFLGDTILFLAVVHDAAGALAPDAPVSWSSSENDVVQVSESGLATAVGPGTAVVRATAGALQREATVVVAQVPTGVLVSPPTGGLASIGEVLQLSGVVHDLGGSAIEGRALSWRSSEDGVATVDSTGKVTAVSNGTAVIHAEMEDLSGQATVEVKQVVKGVGFALEPIAPLTGTTFQIQVEAVDALGTRVTDTPVTVSLALEANSTGARLTGTTTLATSLGVASFGDLSVEGVGRNLTIRADAGVLPPVRTRPFSVLSPFPAATVRIVERGVTIMGIGETADVTLEAEDANGDPALPPTPHWSSRNPGIASVSVADVVTGRITARRDGQASITVDAGGLKDEVLVTVMVPGPARPTVWEWGDQDTNSMYDVWATSPNDVWFVGHTGRVKHYDGARVSTVPTGLSTENLESVWASGPDDVWIAIHDGGFLRFNGSSWSRVAPETVGAFHILSVWGSGPDDVWAAGYSREMKETVFHFDGTAWSKSFTGRVNRAMSLVWGVGRDDVWAVDSAGHLWHYDGTGWTEAGPPGNTEKVNDVFGSAGDDVWVMTGTAAWHYDGNSWANQSQGLELTRGFGSGWSGGPRSAWLPATSAKEAWYFDGTAWRMVPLPTASYWGYGIHGSGRGDVWLVAAAGEIARYDGISWRSLDERLTFDSSHGMWGSAPDDIWATSGRGQMLHYDGSHWRTVNAPSGLDLTDMWGSSATDVWAVGMFGALAHYDGASWTSRGPLTSSHLNDVWGSRPDDVWVVGAGGQLIHWDGLQWSFVESPVPVTNMRGVWGMSDSDVWFAGDNAGSGVVLHYDGETMNDRSPPSTSPPLNTIWLTAPDNVWAGGNHDVMLHYDGSSWLNHMVGLESYFSEIWGTGPDDIWALGAVQGCCPEWSRSLVHFDGTAWTDVTPNNLTWNGLRGLWGTRDGPLWAWGYVGTLLKGVR